MASRDTSKDLFRAIAIPDPRSVDASALWDAQSSYDQAGPVPGVPSPQQDTACILKASGSQTAGSELRIKTQNGGFAGHAADSWPATVIHRDGDSGDWYGWDAPVMINARDVLQDGAALSPTGEGSPAILALASGNMIALGTYDRTPFVAVGIRTYTASTNTWDAVATEIFSEGVAGGGIGPSFDVLQLPDGRILLISLDERPINPGELQFTVRYSDDDGATWAVYAEHALRGDTAFTTTTWTFGRVRAEYNPTTAEILICLWATAASGTYPDRLLQFASRDLGSNIDYVGVSAGDAENNQSLTGDLVVVGGVFVILSANPSTDASEGGYHSIRLGSAYDLHDPIASSGSLPGGTSTTIPTTAGENRIAMCVTDGGVVWAYVADTTPTIDTVFAMYSVDGGLTYKVCHGGKESSGYGSIFSPGVSTVYPEKMAAAWHRGRVVLLCNHESPTGTSNDGSLSALYLGGFSTVTLPYRGAVSVGTQPAMRIPDYQVGWERNYLPFDFPDSDGFTLASAGTNTATITGALLNLTTTGASRRNYFVVPSAAAGVGLCVRAAAKATSGYFGVEIREDDNTNRYPALIRLTSTDIHIVDGGTTTVKTTDAHGGGVVEFIAENRAGAVTLWWRDYDSSEAKAWTKASSTVASITATGQGLIRFGITETQAANVDVHSLSFATDTELGEGLTDFSNPSSLQGFPLGAGPDAAEYIADGVKVHAIDGPTAAGDSWNIDTAYTYPVERVFPGTSPSPSHVWRSSTTTAKMSIAWTHGDYDNAWLRPYEVISLRGINFRQAQLQYYDGGSWSDLQEIVAYESFSFDRTGDTVEPSLSGTATDSPYVLANELAGCWFEFPNGDVRKIRTNTEGSLTVGTASYMPARILLEGIDDGENASGTGKIWFKDVTVVYVSLGHRALRIQINDDASPVAPPDGYFEIGQIIAGPAIVFGRDYSLGRSISVSPNTQTATAGDGTRRSRVRGKARRGVDLSFPAVDVSQFSGEGQPDAISVEDNNARYSVTPDEPVKLDGVLEALQGSHVPLMYLPYVPKLDALGSDAVTLTWQRNRGAFYGRLIGGINMRSLAGDESSTEVLTGVSIRIEEEL